VFGDSGGTSIDGKGDFDADTDDFLDIAPFRLPCYTDADGWRPHFRTTSGTCNTTDDPADPNALGVAREVKIINARGLVLDATLWMPPAVREAAPVIVFSNGLSSRQEHYYWFAERMAGQGYVVLTWDPAGQGESEGGWTDLFGVTGANVPATLRAIVACGWFGIQTWIGGLALNALLAAALPAWAGLPGNIWMAFAIFWLVQVAIIVRGLEGIKMLESWSAPLLLGGGARSLV
jgi:hypothetical protein